MAFQVGSVSDVALLEMGTQSIIIYHLIFLRAPRQR